MASAPPMETATLVGHPPPPSYEEAMGSNPQNPPGLYAPADMKGSVPPYPTQAYGQAYPPPPPQQGQPVTSPVGNGLYTFIFIMTLSDHTIINSEKTSINKKKVVYITQKVRIIS